jgi:large subunit ribosomal protein L13
MFVSAADVLTDSARDRLPLPPPLPLQVVGRLAPHIARLLTGKHKPT